MTAALGGLKEVPALPAAVTDDWARRMAGSDPVKARGREAWSIDKVHWFKGKVGILPAEPRTVDFDTQRICPAQVLSRALD